MRRLRRKAILPSRADGLGTARGVWTAAAGIDASLKGVGNLQVHFSDFESGPLNSLAVNCLRSMAARVPVVWGALTLAGADASADEYKYLPVRRLALFLEETCTAARGG